MRKFAFEIQAGITRAASSRVRAWLIMVVLIKSGTSSIPQQGAHCQTPVYYTLVLFPGAAVKRNDELSETKRVCG